MVEKAIVSHPAFRLTSIAGTEWIDPFTGAALPAPFGVEMVARSHLAATRPWDRGLQPKPLEELRRLRWLAWLVQHLEFETDFHHFKRGLWLNPFTGHWLPGVHLEDRRVTARTREDLARILADCPEAEAGKRLPEGRLNTLVAQGPQLGDLTPGPVPVADGPPVARPARTITSTYPRPATVAVQRAATASSRPPSELADLRKRYLAMLPHPPRLEGYQLVLRAEPRAAVARDLFDFIALDHRRLLWCVGECRGLGPVAPLVPPAALEALRTAARTQSGLVDVLANASDRLRSAAPGGSLALFAAVLDLPVRTLTYASAGHHPALLVHSAAGTRMEQLIGTGTALGSEPGASLARILQERTVALDPGDVVVAYTDGIWRRNDAANPQLGRMGVQVSCATHARLPLPELVAAVIADAHAAAGAPVAEDGTVIGLRVK